jgi:hypothetical protein
VTSLTRIMGVHCRLLTSDQGRGSALAGAGILQVAAWWLVACHESHTPIRGMCHNLRLSRALVLVATKLATNRVMPATPKPALVARLMAEKRAAQVARPQ